MTITRATMRYPREKCTAQYLASKETLLKPLGLRVVGGVYRKGQVTLFARKV